MHVSSQWMTCRDVLSVLHNSVFIFADVDFVTPLCSQVVYEGLVDDIFRIKCGRYLYDSALVADLFGHVSSQCLFCRMCGVWT